MSRTLLLMRHAKSSWDAPITDDAERPLSKRGWRDAPRVGAWMAGEGLAPVHVFCSPAVRARQTAESVLKQLDPPTPSIQFDPRIYSATLDRLLAVLTDVPAGGGMVLLVGHNPALDELCQFLCAAPPPLTANGKLMTTAALAQIELPDAWSSLPAGAGRLVRLTRPKMLAS